MEADLVKRAGVPFEAIPAAGVHGVGLRSLPGNLRQLSRGFVASRRILANFQPDVLFFTGGYVAAPMAIAGRRWFSKSVHAVLYVPDLEPGLALKTLARFADRIAITVEESRPYFSRQHRVIVTGYPVRSELLLWDRPQAFRAMNLLNDLPVLLVFGGSTGAQSINRALLKALPELLKVTQIIHITGQRNWEDGTSVQNNLETTLAERYHPYPYLHEEMGAALRAADLVVSRAGASSLGEYPAFGLPAVLVPYPYAWRYQQINAEYLAARGAAMILPDEVLADRLVPVVTDLITKPVNLAQMRAAMQALARPDAAEQIAAILEGIDDPDWGAK
jgi:UDP-N-acetylglucosamine--N-acetylmuramyl-(pentapeptide) pyrophosphoryl-undecaprenol N-acetylglucosamine transferase